MEEPKQDHPTPAKQEKTESSTSKNEAAILTQVQGQEELQKLNVQQEAIRKAGGIPLKFLSGDLDPLVQEKRKARVHKIKTALMTKGGSPLRTVLDGRIQKKPTIRTATRMNDKGKGKPSKIETTDANGVKAKMPRWTRGRALNVVKGKVTDITRPPTPRTPRFYSGATHVTEYAYATMLEKPVRQTDHIVQVTPTTFDQEPQLWTPKYSVNEKDIIAESIVRDINGRAVRAMLIAPPKKVRKPLAKLESQATTESQSDAMAVDKPDNLPPTRGIRSIIAQTTQTQDIGMSTKSAEDSLLVPSTAVNATKNSPKLKSDSSLRASAQNPSRKPKTLPIRTAVNPRALREKGHVKFDDEDDGEEWALLEDNKIGRGKENQVAKTGVAKKGRATRVRKWRDAENAQPRSCVRRNIEEL
jgi:hypothetical protein